MTKNLTIFGLIIVGVLAFTAAPAQAQPVDISVQSRDTLAFGMLSAPSDFTAIWTLSEVTGGLINTGGNSFNFTPGEHHPGSVVITGEPNSIVNYSIAVTTPFTDPSLNLTLTPLGSKSVILGPVGNVDVEVFVGGVLTIGTSATSGPNSGAVITMTVNYE